MAFIKALSPFVRLSYCTTERAAKISVNVILEVSFGQIADCEIPVKNKRYLNSTVLPTNGDFRRGDEEGNPGEASLKLWS